MPQTSLAEFVEALDKAQLLTRIKEEKRVDELPALMEANPDTAILVEHVKDCKFPFLANAYGVRPMYALSLDCDETKVGLEIARRSELRFKPEMVDTAPCKDVIIKGDDIDLTMFPLFHHHPKDGQAYLNDTNVVSRDPDHQRHRPGHLPVHVSVARMNSTSICAMRHTARASPPSSSVTRERTCRSRS